MGDFESVVEQFESLATLLEIEEYDMEKWFPIMITGNEFSPFTRN